MMVARAEVIIMASYCYPATPEDDTPDWEQTKVPDFGRFRPATIANSRQSKTRAAVLDAVAWPGESYVAAGTRLGGTGTYWPTGSPLCMAPTIPVSIRRCYGSAPVWT